MVLNACTNGTTLRYTKEERIKRFSSSEAIIMDKNEVYLLIAVFVILMVILVWIGTKMILDMRRRKQRRKTRREEWIQRINARRDAE